MAYNRRYRSRGSSRRVRNTSRRSRTTGFSRRRSSGDIRLVIEHAGAAPAVSAGDMISGVGLAKQISRSRF